MRISDCNKDNVAVSIEKLHKYNEKLRKYYALKEKDKESVDYMYKELKTLINILGKEHFFNL